MEQSKVELSIIVPVYNVEKYLEECLNSISRIKNINYEILIINDDSPDNSQKIIDEFCKNNIRAKYFIKENGGISSARNYGLKRSKGEYIWFVDSDDLIDYKEFQNFFARIKKDNVDIAIANYYFFNKNKIFKESKLFYFDKSLSGREILNKHGKILLEKGFVWRNLYRREFLEKNDITFKEKIVAEDQLFNILCFFKANKVKYINNFIYYYRINREGSLTKNIESEKLFAESGYKIVSELLKYKETQNNFYIKRNMFAHYLTYVKYFKKRDFELERKLWNLKGVFFIKLEKKYKIWRFFRKLK